MSSEEREEQGKSETGQPTTWLPDPSHYPEQLTPLSATVWFEAIGRGLHAAMAELKGPFGGFDARIELGWAYEGDWEPEWDHDPATMDRAAFEIARSWEDDLKPRSHAITASLAGLHPEAPSPQEAGNMLDRAWNLILEQWKIHFLAVIPAQKSAEMFSRRYLEVMGNDDELAPYHVLEAAPNETHQADAAVWALAERATALNLGHIFVEYPADLVLERLSLTHNGRLLKRDLDDYLLRYGGQSRWHELSLPREVEAPYMTIESIRLFIESGRGPRSADPTRAADLEAALLRADPSIDALLAAAKVGHSLKESHVYHIDYPTLLVTRELLLGFGRRLVAGGQLERVDDVWMLRRQELKAAVVATSIGASADLVAERRAELAKGLREGPLTHLGEPPAPGERDAILEKFYGSAVAHGRDVTGTGASPGIATGPARMVRGPDDFGRVRPGDILVATTTTPAWTPLFPSLAGIITESGGVLCHGAIVAREYGIPAVVGVRDATDRIPDGALITLDGFQGSVELNSDRPDGRTDGPRGDLPDGG